MIDIIHLMVRMRHAAIKAYVVEILIRAKSCKNRESAAFASNRGGFNDYSPIKFRDEIGSARLQILLYRIEYRNGETVFRIYLDVI